MLLLFRQSARHVHRSRTFATASPSRLSGKQKELGVIERLEQDAGRILRVVQHRAEERKRLMNEESKNAGSADHIQRAKLLKELEPLHQAWSSFNSTKSSLLETYTLLEDEDPEIRSMAAEERDSLEQVLQDHVATTFPSLLLSSSPTRHFSALIELKSGVGGDESSLFLSDVLRMYQHHASSENFRTQIVSLNELDGSKGAGGGIKDAILEVQGEGSYDFFRWESGVHRVQRVPATETQGRVHTSTITVMVLPTSEEKGEETDFHIDEKDIRTEVMRARGAGGQHVNKTESAVRLTHVPTGITVSMQDSRSQHQNRAKAWQILRARLLDLKITEDLQKRRDSRRSLVKSADRSQKIRTYNFPQNRITDHRIGFSSSNLDTVLEGEGLQDFIHELRKDHEASMIEDLLNESTDS